MNEKKMWERGFYDCGLEVQKPTQSLKSVKGPGNRFYSNPSWARILLSLIYFSWDVHRNPSPTFFFHSSNLVFDTLLWA
jgi:hypothetical protein